MATGKMPFHKGEEIYIHFLNVSLDFLVVNTGALLLKLGSERQPPDIPQELSDTAKDFLTK